MTDMVKIANNHSRQSLYDGIAGQEGLISLVNVFYDFVESTAEGRPVAKLHLRGHGIGHARIELVNFLSGFLGGPNLFAEKWGHSNVRHIHDHVNINQEASESWMSCMEMAMEQLNYSIELKQRLRDSFQGIAILLINQ